MISVFKSSALQTWLERKWEVAEERSDAEVERSCYVFAKMGVLR